MRAAFARRELATVLRRGVLGRTVRPCYCRQEAPALTASAGAEIVEATSNSNNNQYVLGYMPLYPFLHSQPSMLIVGCAGIGERNSSSPGIGTDRAYI